MQRITARVALRQVRPRELAGLRATLLALPALAAAVPQDSALLSTLHASLQPNPDIADALRAIADEPAVLLRDGGVIAHGVDGELDELRGIHQHCDAFLLELEQRERTRTGIGNLRVMFNKVHGYHIEVTASNLSRVPADYQRRQTLKNAERFITPELKAFEDKALSAQERALAREKWLYEQLLDTLQPHLRELSALAEALASLDALAALAERALTLGWCRPEFVTHPCIDIESGRHPVVEMRLSETERRRVHRQPLPARRAHQAAGHHRPQHGRQEHLHAPGGADRTAGGDGLLRAGREPAASGRSTPSTRASARPTTWPMRNRPSCWR